VEFVQKPEFPFAQHRPNCGSASRRIFSGLLASSG
jgi:hypothetical protein